MWGQAWRVEIDSNLIFSLENGESNPKNNSQLYNSNFIRSEIKLYKYILFNKYNQIIDSWN